MLEQENWFTLLAGLVAVVTFTLWRLQSTREEAAVNYTVPIPEPCQRDWAGELEQLEVPSIQVCWDLKTNMADARLTDASSRPRAHL